MTVENGDPVGAGGLQQADDRGPGRARSGQHDPDVVQGLAGHPQRVEQGRQDHDGGAVLVVVEDRHVQGVPQLPFQVEAARRGDVFQAHAAEPGRDRADAPDHLRHLPRVQAQRPGVDPGEPLVQRGLALQHRQGGARADVAQAEHRGPVADHRDRVTAYGQPPGRGRVLRDRPAVIGDTGRVDLRQRPGVINLHGWAYLDPGRHGGFSPSLARVDQREADLGLVDPAGHALPSSPAASDASSRKNPSMLSVPSSAAWSSLMLARKSETSSAMSRDPSRPRPWPKPRMALAGSISTWPG